MFLRWLPIIFEGIHFRETHSFLQGISLSDFHLAAVFCLALVSKTSPYIRLNEKYVFRVIFSRVQQTVKASVGTPASSSLEAQRGENICSEQRTFRVFMSSVCHEVSLTLLEHKLSAVSPADKLGRANSTVCNQLFSLLQPPSL